MTRIGRRLSVALAATWLSCAPLPPVDERFETDWSAAKAQCDAYSAYCNVTLRSAWIERTSPWLAVCNRELERPDPSGFRLIVTLSAAGEILALAESPTTAVSTCFLARIDSLRLPAPPVASFRFPLVIGRLD